MILYSKLIERNEYMASEHVQALVDKVRNKFSKADLNQFPDKLAIQFNLTGKIDGVFYVEVLDGVLSVMPYEYIDRDVLISATKTNLEKIIDGKLNIQTAISTGKVQIDGNIEKATMLEKFM
jgi:putative sterol carrier protein